VHVGLALLTMFPGRVGGSETYVRGLLSEFGKGNGPERVTVLGNRHVMDAYSDNGPVQLHHVRSYQPGDSNATRFAALQFARVAPRAAARDVPGDLDLIHYPVTIPIPRVPGKPSVVSLLDVQHHELPQMFSALERRLRAWAYDDAAREADVVVTISEHSRGAIVERLGIDAERVVAIPLGVDHARFSPDGPRADGVPERYVFYPANMWPHKNHERLLDAFERVDDEDLWLVLTGQPYGNEALLEGRERVLHLGHVSAEQIVELYRGAVGLVFPSLFEGFGLPVLEAMACGTAVATSERGSLAEVAGDAALTFDPEDVDAIAAAIVRLASDDVLRAELREKGIARAAHFTWAATAEQHLQVYERARLSARSSL
jgi:glycosyltransferase involved in cell wall biosynthesis